jgi:hypothetical protein
VAAVIAVIVIIIPPVTGALPPVVFRRADIPAVVAGEPTVRVGDTPCTAVRAIQRGSIPATIHAAAIGRDLALPGPKKRRGPSGNGSLF